VLARRTPVREHICFLRAPRANLRTTAADLSRGRRVGRGGALLSILSSLARAPRRGVSGGGLAVWGNVGIIGSRLVLRNIRIGLARRVLSGVVGRRLILGAGLLLLLIGILVLLRKA
jgi:hypothetical protein